MPDFGTRTMAPRPLPLSQAREIDAYCDRFEVLWRSGSDARPTVETLLAEVPEPLRAAVLPELVALDAALRRGVGERPTPEEYRARFPTLGEQVDALIAARARDTGATQGPDPGSSA